MIGAPSESALHAAVASFLAHALPLRCVWTTFPLGGGGKIRGGKLKASGTRKGWPDLQVVWDGRIYGIELKTATGRVSPEQRECHADLTEAGAHVAVCRSVEDVETALRGWNIPLRASIKGIAA